MEDFSIKAIVIGVSLFVTMITLSAIIIYFNTAKSIADKVNERTDIANSYDYIMNTDNFTDELTGTEVRSLINKYAGSKEVIINISIIEDMRTVDYENINNTWLNDEKLISEVWLNLINPGVKYTVDKVEEESQTILNIH